MEKEYPMIILIAAMAQENRIIGNKGDLPAWKIPEDMTRFKKLTTGHPVIMGRKTWDSLDDRWKPLPNRTNIVITRQMNFNAPGAVVVHSIEDAFAAAERFGDGDIFVIGGEEIYRQAIPYAHKIYLTVVEGEFEGDTFFPEFETFSFREVAREKGISNGYEYAFVTYEGTWL